MCVGDGTRETPAGGVRRTGMLPWSSGQELWGSGGRRTTRAGVATNRETKINNFCVTLLTTPIPFMFDRKKRKGKKPGRKVWFGSGTASVADDDEPAQRKLCQPVCGDSRSLTNSLSVLCILLSMPMPGTPCNEPHKASPWPREHTGP